MAKATLKAKKAARATLKKARIARAGTLQTDAWRAFRKARDASGSLSGLAVEAVLEKGRRMMASSYGWPTVSTQLSRVKSLPVPDRKAIQSLVEERPLMLGAIGMGLGMMLGAMLPDFRTPAPARKRARQAVGRPTSRH